MVALELAGRDQRLRALLQPRSCTSDGALHSDTDRWRERSVEVTSWTVNIASSPPLHLSSDKMPLPELLSELLPSMYMPLRRDLWGVPRGTGDVSHESVVGDAETGKESSAVAEITIDSLLYILAVLELNERAWDEHKPLLVNWAVNTQGDKLVGIKGLLVARLLVKRAAETAS